VAIRLALSLLVVLTMAIPVCAQEMIVSAAISTKEAVERLGGGFMRSHAGVTLRFNFGASGELQKQIEAGAPVDVFISAAERQMDALERGGFIRPETRRVFARNVLVVIKPADFSVDLSKPADLLDRRVSRIAVGNPKTVPVGQYSEQSLRTLGLWDQLQAKLVLAESVRQALEYVARGEVEAGFVYATDAAVRRGRVTEAFRPPEDTYSAVVYPAAVVRDSRQPALAEALLALLVSAEGQAVLAQFGFQPPGYKRR
jgi:molybdate transport system substrate-binding protein